MSNLSISHRTLFKSPDAEAQYREAYDATMALWDIEYETIEVDTRFGITHINAAGSPDLPTLILLHGAAVCSTSWYANAGVLGRHFRVYAPDLIDYTGLSIAERPIKTRRDCSNWLTDVLDALNIERTAIAGHSYGGWLALNYAMSDPQRIERMILLAPAPSFGGIRWQFVLRFIPVFLMPTRRMFYRIFQSLSTALSGDYHPLIEQFVIGIRTFKPEATTLSVMSFYKDEELKQINLPVLLLVGEREKVYNPEKALERAGRLLPDIETELITDAGHMLIVDRADIVNDRILKFLKKTD